MDACVEIVFERGLSSGAGVDAPKETLVQRKTTTVSVRILRIESMGDSLYSGEAVV